MLDGTVKTPPRGRRPKDPAPEVEEYKRLKKESEQATAKELKELRTDPAGAPRTERPSEAPAVVSLIRGDAIRPEPVDWVWGGWLARGKVHVMAGAPGTGKTTSAIALAAIVTSGGRWPDGARARAGHVVMWSGEDDPRDTLVPRLIAAEADLRRVHLVAGIADARGPRGFDPGSDIAALSDALMELPEPPALLIVDPLVSAVAGDSHKNAEVRRALQPLVELAQVRRCAVLGISHFSKGTVGRDPVERVTGSLAFGALARVVLATAKLPDNEGGGRILVRAKSNLGHDSGGFRYDIEAHELESCPGVHTTRLLWREALEGTARELLGRAETQEQPDDAEGETAADVEAFVLACLADGPVSAKQMQADANGAGFSWDRVKRAARKVGVERRKDGFKAGWVWALRREHADEECTEGSEECSLTSVLPSHSSAHSSPSCTLRSDLSNTDSEAFS